MRVKSFGIVVFSLSATGCLGIVSNGGHSDAGTSGAVYFDPDIQASMDIVGCSATGCHCASGTPMHVIAVAQGGSADANYAEVLSRTSGGAMSLFLTKPVAGNSVMHSGGKLIPANSATYNQWLAWVNAGAPLRAPGSKAAPPSATDGGATAPPSMTSNDMAGCLAVKAPTTSSHNKGQECLTCHATGQSATLRWTLAGTLWTDVFGTTPRAGATIEIVDGKGVTLQLTTDVEGNFFTTQPITFPVTAMASGCPSTRAMVQKSATGGCNATGCHDAAMPMFLP